MEAVNFEVAYRFAEYRQFALEHVRESRGASPGVFGRLFISIVAAIAFAVKKTRMPVCSFSIDDTGIRRRTAVSNVVVAWPQVKRVFRYAPGYVIEVGRGAMPIPYRCLTERQRATFEELLGRR